MMPHSETGHRDDAAPSSPLATPRGSEAQLENHTRTLQRLERSFGTRHPALVEACRTLALFHIGRGRSAQAETLLKRCLEIQEQALGVSHRELVPTLELLGDVLRTAGRSDEAALLDRRRRGLESQAEVDDRPESAPWREALETGERLAREGRTEECEATLRRALQLARGFGPHDLRCARSAAALGLLYLRQGRHEEAVHLLEEALTIRKHRLGADDLDVAATWTSLGLSFTHLRRHDEAVRAQTHALVIRERLLGERHPATIDALFHLGVTFSIAGRYSRAEPLLRRALDLRRKVLGADHPGVAAVLDKLSRLLRHTGQLEEARRRELEAQTIRLIARAS